MCNCCEKIEKIKNWLAQRGELVYNEEIWKFIEEIENDGK